MNNSLWEEQAFAEDVSGINNEVGGCVWPPRSYSCSFCARDFRSAQALGGHMNVHRRDRASRFIKQSSPIVIPHHQTDELVPQTSRASNQYCTSFDDILPSPASRVSTLWYTNPNPNPEFYDNTGLLVVSPSSHVADEIPANSIKIRQDKKSKENGAKIQDFKIDEEVTSCKRRRLIEAKPPSSLFPKLISAVDRIFLPQSEVSYKLRSGSFEEELDLELRLGAWCCDPKVKL